MKASKSYTCLIFLLLFSAQIFAAIPEANLYRVIKRNYANEPEPQGFTISAQDEAFLTKPNISTYTQLHPENPKAIYTLPPYPATEFLPKLGKWMTVMDFNGLPSYLFSEAAARSSKTTLVPAHWISLKNTRGQYIIEPINYILIVYDSQNKPLAKLNSIFHQIGFSGIAAPPQYHSAGYYAYIGGKRFPQLVTPEGKALTYSNGHFQLQNDHLRIFGLYQLKINKQAVAVFSVAISEESGLAAELAGLSEEQLKLKLAEMDQQNINGSYYKNYGHHFVSFANARNNLALALIKAGCSTYYASLGNVVNTLGESTEDHDGNVYITVIK